PEQRVFSNDFADEVAQHRLGDQVVGDDAVTHGSADDDAAWRAAQHLARVRADGDNAVVGSRVGHHRWLVEHNAAAHDVDDHVGCAQIDADVLRKHDAASSAEVYKTGRAISGFTQSGLWGRS